MEIAKKEGCEATEELERLTPLFSDRAKLVGRPRSCVKCLCPLSLISTIGPDRVDAWPPALELTH